MIEYDIRQWDKFLSRAAVLFRPESAHLIIDGLQHKNAGFIFTGISDYAANAGIEDIIIRKNIQIHRTIKINPLKYLGIRGGHLNPQRNRSEVLQKAME
jgi:hypothetical protein